MDFHPWMLDVLLPPSCYALTLIFLQEPSVLQVTAEGLISWFWTQV